MEEIKTDYTDSDIYLYSIQVILMNIAENKFFNLFFSRLADVTFKTTTQSKVKQSRSETENEEEKESKDKS